jgi:hypothetical protein
MVAGTIGKPWLGMAIRWLSLPDSGLWESNFKLKKIKGRERHGKNKSLALLKGNEFHFGTGRPSDRWKALEDT